MSRVGQSTDGARVAAWTAVLAASLVSVAVAAGAPVPEPAGYRMVDYRAPVPETLAGARVVTTGEAERLWRSGDAAFVDVMPRPVKPKNLPAGTIWRDRPRHGIPGSLWLPNVGYGVLAPEVDAYYRRGLEEASGGDRERVLVIYCMADCWMSWNAARRAVEMGYRNVVWYPDGTDGWSSAGLPLERQEPMLPNGG